MKLQDAALIVIPTPKIDLDLFEFGFGHERFIFSERFEAQSLGPDDRTATVGACLEKIMKEIGIKARERKVMPRFLKLESPTGMGAMFSKGGEFRVMNAFDVNTGKTYYAVDVLVEM